MEKNLIHRFGGVQTQDDQQVDESEYGESSHQTPPGPIVFLQALIGVNLQGRFAANASGERHATGR